MPTSRKRRLALTVAVAAATVGTVAWAAEPPAVTGPGISVGVGQKVASTADARATPPAVPAAPASSSAAAAPRVWELQTSVVEIFIRTLAAGERMTVETTELSPGADPVLHLLDTGGQQVAMNDNGGGGTSALLTYRSPVNASYYLVLRARSTTTGGTTRLVTKADGSESRRTVSFAPWQPISLSGLRAGERITSVRLPGGNATGHTLFLLKADGVGIEQRQAANGVADAAEIVMGSALGTRSVVLASAGGGASERARLVRNDAALLGHDSDVDGLGHELEAAAGTCAGRSDQVPGVSCAAATDLRDTDGDGISDGVELVGTRRSVVGGTEELPLPRWGANPRHKDLFVEVDFMRRTKQENDDQVRLTMATSVARNFAKFYGDELTTDPGTRALHASMVGNPDGRPGIAVHLDIGRNPETAADAAVYGDWGGYTAVDAVQVDGGYQGAKASTAWKTAMSQARRGIFRYALGYGTGGGQAGRGFAASYNFNSSFVAPHETGHSLGLGHGGPAGLEPDVNCKPNYPSLMNYAFDSGEAGFADGRTADGPPLNNWALKESNVADGASTAFFDRLENVFGYRVDRAGGHIDWNRDGEFAPADTTVRAYANLALTGGGCEYTRWNRTRVGDAVSTLPPALARRDGKLFTFYTYGNEVRSSVSGSSWNCPVPEEFGCAGGTWDATASLGLPAPAGSVDAVTIGSPGQESVLVVAVDLDHGLWERRLGAASSTAWKKLPGTATLGGPSLVRGADGSVYLAYADPSGAYRMQRRTASGVWTAEEPFLGADGTELRRPAGSRLAPSLVEATLSWRPGQPRIYALLAGSDDKLDLWGLDPSSRRWTNTQLLDTRPGPVNWRPAMAWVPPGPASAVGRLHIVYAGRDGAQARMMMSYVAVRETADGITKTQRVGVHTYFDNSWRTIGGADLLYEPGADSNLRAVISHTGSREIWFRPKADGINNSTYRNQNDWTVLRGDVCSGVVNPGGLVANPIRCAATPASGPGPGGSQGPPDNEDPPVHEN